MGCHTWCYHNPQPLPCPIDYEEWEFEAWKDGIETTLSEQEQVEECDKERSQLRSWLGKNITVKDVERYRFENAYMAQYFGYDDVSRLLSPDRKSYYTEHRDLHDMFRLHNYPSFILHNHKQAIQELKAYCTNKNGIFWQGKELTYHSTDKEWADFEQYLFELWEENPELVIIFG